MVHSDLRRSPRSTELGGTASPGAALSLKSPIGKTSLAKKLATPNTASPSSARRITAEHLAARSISSEKRTASASSAQRAAQGQNYKEKETLTVRLNVYDLVWNRNDNTGEVKNAAAGFENLGFGLYHSALEIWGKEISFGHSKRYKSGVFAVKPKRCGLYVRALAFVIHVSSATFDIVARYCTCLTYPENISLIFQGARVHAQHAIQNLHRDGDSDNVAPLDG